MLIVITSRAVVTTLMGLMTPSTTLMDLMTPFTTLMDLEQLSLLEQPTV